MPFDGEHFDAPLPGLDHPLFAPHDAVELVDGEINDKLEFSALYAVADHDFVTGKQPTYYNGNANALRRSVQMAGRANQHFGTAAWENNQHTVLYYPAPPALLNIGTKDFTILVVYQSDAAGDVNHGINCVTSIANAGGSVTNRQMAAIFHNTYNTSDRTLYAEIWDGSTPYSLASASGHVVHKRTQVALFTRRGGQMSLWAFGQRLAAAANTASLAGTGNLAVGAMKVVDGTSPFYGLTGYVHLVSWWSRGMVDAEAAERSASPFAQYRPAPWMVGWRAPGATIVSLAGLATAIGRLAGGQSITRSPKGTASAAGRVAAGQTIARALAGTGTARGAAASAVTKQIAGTAAAQGRGLAATGLTRSLAGRATAQGRASAAATLARLLAGTGFGFGAAKAAPSLTRALAGTATGRGAGAGPLALLRSLAGRAFGFAAAQAPNPTIVTVSLSALATLCARGAAAMSMQRDLAGRATSANRAAAGHAVTRSLMGRAVGASCGAAGGTVARVLAGLASGFARMAAALSANPPGAIPRTGGAVTSGGGSDGVASARGSSGTASARPSSDPATPR